MLVADIVKELQIPTEPYPHFNGTWEELIELVEKAWEGRKALGDDVWEVQVPAEQFRVSERVVTEHMDLWAEFDPELGVIEVRTLGPKAQAQRAYVVGQGDTIVAFQAWVETTPPPPHPLLMAKLMRDKKYVFNGEEYQKSILYWANRVMVEEV